jgi:hypothetical protein
LSARSAPPIPTTSVITAPNIILYFDLRILNSIRLQRSAAVLAQIRHAFPLTPQRRFVQFTPRKCDILSHWKLSRRSAMLLANCGKSCDARAIGAKIRHHGFCWNIVCQAIEFSLQAN